jgi:hypothetical protein
MRKITNMYKINGRNHFRDLVANGREILKFVLNKYGVGVWNGFNWLGIGSNNGILRTK